MKILDPACGSGAFPIGALQKIVFILQQVDADGRIWFQKQIQNVSPEMKRVIKREFENENFDYIRKLGVVRKNIYGVDIQPIATEISRLRCFLTLIVDESVHDDLENRGIEPLPNLDFKFVTANSLIGLPKPSTSNQQGLFEDESGIGELKELREMFFNASGVEREKLKLQFVQAQKRMFEKVIEKKRGGMANLTGSLMTWDPFGHKASTWFDPEWMFGIKEGFGIVIANPPYLSSKNMTGELKPFYEKEFHSPTAHYDIYIIFIEKALQLLKKGGNLCFITSNKYFSQKYGSKIREILLHKHLLRIINFNLKVFEATVDTAITIVDNNENTSNDEVKLLNLYDSDLKNGDNSELGMIINTESRYSTIKQNFFKELPDMNFRLDIGKKESDLQRKIYKDTINLSEICFVIYGAVLHNAEKGVKKDEFIYKQKANNLKPYIEGKYISRWRVNKTLFLKFTPDVHREPRYQELFENHKLIGKRIIGRDGLSFLYDQDNLYADNTVYVIIPYYSLPLDKYSQLKSIINGGRIKLSKQYDLLFLLSLINSNLFKWLFQKFFSFGLDIYPAHIKKLPIKEASEAKQKPFIELVDKILAITKTQDYLDNPVKQEKVKEYENEIDQIVYKLYGLTDKEVEIVENSTKKLIER